MTLRPLNHWLVTSVVAGGLVIAMLAALVVGATAVPLPAKQRSQARHVSNAVPFPLHHKVTITVMTNPDVWEGFTKKTSSGTSSIASFYTYYHKIWEKELPNLVIKEEEEPTTTDEETKTLLGVESRSAPDLVAFHTFIAELVSRGALMDLTPFFKQAHIKMSSMLPAMVAFSKYNGQLYAMPGASGPIGSSIVYVPALVKQAGINPNDMPRTYKQLMRDSRKVVKFGPGHKLERIGAPVETPAIGQDVASFCNSNTALWNPKSGWHLDAKCVADYYQYELSLVKLYGGWTTYEKFITGNPGPWSCSKSDYSATGKMLFNYAQAYWNGGQWDHCYNVTWALSPAPTVNGTLAEAVHYQLPQWFVAIPKGTPKLQAEAAFDLWYVTIYQHGNLDGPTTNGYVRSGTTYADAWWKDLVATQAAIRKKNGFPGNPMASVVTLEKKEANVARWTYPKTTIDIPVNTLMTDAWDNIVYHHQSVTEALRSAQSQVEHDEQTTPGGKLVH